LTILKRMNMDVNNHMSVMNDEMIEKVEQFFRDIKKGADKKEKEEKEGKALQGEEAKRNRKGGGSRGRRRNGQMKVRERQGGEGAGQKREQRGKGSQGSNPPLKAVVAQAGDEANRSGRDRTKRRRKKKKEKPCRAKRRSVTAREAEAGDGAATAR